MLIEFIERFMAKVDVGEGCWEWQGRKRNGYGSFYHKGKRLAAHRLSLVLFGFTVPSNRMVCHTCNNKGCVRPSHLYVGDASTNTYTPSNDFTAVMPSSSVSTTNPAELTRRWW